MSPLRADHSRVAVYKLREQVDTPNNWGVIPAGAPDTFALLRTESFQGQRRTRRSEIRKQNRRPGPLRNVGQDSQGGIEIEVAAEAQFESLLEEALAATFTADLGISAATISFDDADNSINDSGNGFTNILVGSWISVGGSTANDGRWYVGSKPSDGKIIVSFGTISNEAAGPTITINGSTVRDGTKFISAAWERHNTEFTNGNRYRMYRGQVVSTFGLQLTFEEIVRASLGFVGLAPDDAAAATGFSQAPSAAPEIETKLLDVSNNMKLFREGGTINGNIRDLSINWGNNPSLLPAAQVLNPVGVTFGGKTLTGNLVGYLEEADGRPVTAESFAATSLHFELVPDVPATDPTYVITIPRIKYTGMGDVPKSANEGPVLVELGWEAEDDTTLGYMLQVSKLPAA